MQKDTQIDANKNINYNAAVDFHDDLQTTKPIWPTEARDLIGREIFDFFKSRQKPNFIPRSLVIERSKMSSIS